MGKASWQHHHFTFKRPSGTSRGVLTTKSSYFLLWDDPDFGMPAVGECSLIDGLSPDLMDSYETTLDHVVQWMNGALEFCPDLTAFPSIRFGLETLMLDRIGEGSKMIYPSAFTAGRAQMQINGLVWMGDKDFMRSQIIEKVEAGFNCIKLKIGAIDFQTELQLLESIRKEFGNELELRVDANGAFGPEEAMEKLGQLSAFDLHSIEQPIAPGQWEAMAELCRLSPVDIALDEELIGIHDPTERKNLLNTIRPQYIILKPSLHDGLTGTEHWIDLVEDMETGWWMTSALESNIGLNAIAQYAFSKDVVMPQGLGTGSLYTDNFESPLYLQGQMIGYDPTKIWELNRLLT